VKLDPVNLDADPFASPPPSPYVELSPSLVGISKLPTPPATVDSPSFEFHETNLSDVSSNAKRNTISPSTMPDIEMDVINVTIASLPEANCPHFSFPSPSPLREKERGRHFHCYFNFTIANDTYYQQPTLRFYLWSKYRYRC
jgi:hypothetical protein